MKKPRSPVTSATPGPSSIRIDEALTKTEFLHRLKIGNTSWNTMRAAGLRSVLIGRQRYVLGADALAFFTKMAERQDGEENETPNQPR